MSFTYKISTVTILALNVIFCILGFKSVFIHNKVSWWKQDFVSAMKLDLSESIRETHYGLLTVAKLLNDKILYYPQQNPVRIDRSDLLPVKFFFQNFSNVQIIYRPASILGASPKGNYARLHIYKQGDYSPIMFILSDKPVYTTYLWKETLILAPEGFFN